MGWIQPQYDGTPYWRLLLLVETSLYGELVNIIRKYALKEDGDEEGDGLTFYFDGEY